MSLFTASEQLHQKLLSKPTLSTTLMLIDHRPTSRALANNVVESSTTLAIEECSSQKKEPQPSMKATKATCVAFVYHIERSAAEKINADGQSRLVYDDIWQNLSETCTRI
ncbi:hypothetical protein Aduo_016828 [Ancylostoma duodenale]